MRLVSHVIPCLENIGMTIQCLTELRKYTPEPNELIIVDDGSKVPVMEDIKEEFGIDLIIRHDEIMGFSKSINDGIRAATGDFIAIWNNDLLVSDNWLTPVLEVFESDTEHVYGMLAPRLYESVHNDYNNVSAIGGPDNFKKVFGPGWNKDVPHPLNDWTKGMPWVFRKELFEQIGYFDEQFFPTQFEDNDFLLRMAVAHSKHAQVEGTAVYHYSAFTQNTVLVPKFIDYPRINAERFGAKWGGFNMNYQYSYATGRNPNEEGK